MNDKVKELLKNAEQSDAIAINKWRIENREQLRKERKEKLKELMEKDKQQTAVEWLYNELLNAEPNVLEWNKLLEQAKEMDKKQSIGLIKQTAMFMAASHLDEEIANMSYEDVYKTYYEQTYGGGEQ